MAIVVHFRTVSRSMVRSRSSDFFLSPSTSTCKLQLEKREEVIAKGYVDLSQYNELESKTANKQTSEKRRRKNRKERENDEEEIERERTRTDGDDDEFDDRQTRREKK